MTRRTGTGAVQAILAAALALRIVAAFTFPVYPLVDNTADTEIYDAGAHSLAAGQGYLWQGQATAFFPVGWPLLLSFAYRAGGVGEASGHALNVLLSMLLLIAAWKCAERLAGPRAGFVTLVVTAFAPHMVVYPAFLMSETAFTAFFVGSLFFLARGVRSRDLIPAGLLMGCATLIRGPALVMPLLVLLVARFVHRRSPSASLAAAVAFGLALLVPVLPWAARNHRVFGRWVMVANDGGMNFLMGNHHGATGARHEPDEGLPDTGDEVRDDREGYRRGLAFVRQHPGEFLLLLPKKLIRLVVPAPLLTYRAELFAKWPRPLAWAAMGLDQLLHAALWMLAFLALLRRRGAPEGARRAMAFAVPVLGVWIAIHLVFLGGARYFFPAMPALVILAAVGFLRKDGTSAEA